MNNRSSSPVLPSAPAELVAVAVGGFQVILAWTETGADGLGCRIERATGIASTGRFSEIGKVGRNVTAFSDESVKSRTTYSYRVHAWNASGDSPPSNAVEVTTLPSGTEPPADQE